MAQGVNPDLTEMFSPEELEKYHRLRQKGARHAHLTDAVAGHNRARQEALASKMNPGRFNTFGDD